MGASYIYKSTDVSAPTLLDGLGYLISVLDKVLVDGYGTKDPLGWTKEYYSPDNKISVYRNKGTGFFLKIENQANYSTNQIAAKVSTFEAMSDYATGYLRTPEDGSNQYLAYANTKTGTRVCKWVIIGDDKGFWLLVEYSTTAGLWTAFYFGDYTPYHLENKYPWISGAVIGTVDVSTAHLRQYASAINSHLRIARTYQNARPSQSVYLISGTGANSTVSNVELGSHATLTSPVPVFCKPLLLSNTTPPVIIGELPGLFEPINLISSGTVVQESGVAEIHVFQLASNNGHIGLLVGEGFRP